MGLSWKNNMMFKTFSTIALESFKLYNHYIRKHFKLILSLVQTILFTTSALVEII